MAIQDMSAADLAAVLGNDNEGFGGNSGWWIILLFILLGGWGNNGWGGNNGGAGSVGGNELYPWMEIQQTQFNGFSNLTNAVTNGFANAETSATARQMADMNQMFGLSQQFSECCCENRLGLANLGADIAREACATRQNQSDNTQLVLNKLDQLEKDGYLRDLAAERRENDQLRQQLANANLAASQIAQTGQIVDNIYNRLSTCPVGTVPVYGEQPIFTCRNNGCGCGSF